MISKIIAVILSVMSIFSFFKGGINMPAEIDGTNTAADVSVFLPEGTHVTKLYVYRTGSMMEMRFILCEKEDGVYMKSTFSDPESREGAEELDETDSLFFGVDEVFEDEWRAVSIKLDDDVPLREIEKVIEKYGVLGWGDWNKSVELPGGVMDGDYYARTYIELSDGTTVNVRGSNTSPDKWSDFRYDKKRFLQSTPKAQNRENEIMIAVVASQIKDLAIQSNQSSRENGVFPSLTSFPN